MFQVSIQPIICLMNKMTGTNNKIVITGLSGNIGHLLYHRLQDKWEISGIDVKESRELPVKVGDISKYGSVEYVFNGAHTVIHLAANAYTGAGWETIVEPNIIGTQNVFKAAHESGVKKIIFASSNHVMGLYEKDEPYRSIVTGRYSNLNPTVIPQIDHTAPVRPDGYYGASKVFGEALGRFYSEKYGIQVLASDSVRYPGMIVLSI